MNFDLSNNSGNKPENVEEVSKLFEIQYPMVSSVTTGGWQHPPVLRYTITQVWLQFYGLVIQGDAQIPEWLRVIDQVTLFYAGVVKKQHIKKGEKTVF